MVATEFLAKLNSLMNEVLLDEKMALNNTSLNIIQR